MLMHMLMRIDVLEVETTHKEEKLKYLGRNYRMQADKKGLGMGEKWENVEGEKGKVSTESTGVTLCLRRTGS